MKREIKFRAWDKKQKKMSNGMPFEWFLTGEDEDMEFPKTDESLPLKDFIFFKDDFEITQYTGIVDKNKKKIYEGDIIRWSTESGGVWDTPSVDAVTFERGCFLAMLSLREMAYIEVIGNIYENPELLKSKLQLS